MEKNPKINPKKNCYRVWEILNQHQMVERLSKRGQKDNLIQGLQITSMTNLDKLYLDSFKVAIDLNIDSERNLASKE